MYLKIEDNSACSLVLFLDVENRHSSFAAKLDRNRGLLLVFYHRFSKVPFPL